MSPWRRSRAPAFTILEVVVAIAVLATLAAVLVPGIANYLESQGISSTVTTLKSIAKADTTFKTAVTFYPKRISHLGALILTTDTTSCDGLGAATPTTLFGAKNTSWLGPYFPRAVPKSGLPVPLGVINDVQQRTSAGNAAGFIELAIPNVRFDDAERLNDLVDGTAEATNADQSNSLGIVQWAVPTSQGLVTLRYRVGVAATC